MAPRKHRPISVERDAALNALGLLGKKINWDHRPPLSQRPRDPVTGLYTPDELDPRYLFPVAKEDHDKRTYGDHRPLSGDISVAAKLKRVASNQAAFRDRLLAKAPGVPREKRSRIPSRPMKNKSPRVR